MADEQPPRLIICNAYWQENELLCNLSYFEASTGEHLRVRFNEKSQPDGFIPVANGVAYLYAKDVEIREWPPSYKVPMPFVGDSKIRWSEGVPDGIDWQMLIFIFPPGHTLVNATPKPSGAKEFDGRLAIFWLQKSVGEIPHTQVIIELGKLDKNRLSESVRLINLEASSLGLAELHVVDDPDAINALIKNHKQQLQLLNQKRNLFGDNAPETIVTQIQNIEQEIKDLQEQRESLQYNWQSLRRKLDTSFNLEELRNLCFDLHIDSENFSSQKSGFVRELIEYHRRRRTISSLINYCRKERPDISW